MDMEVIDDFYHLMTLDDVNWIELTHLLSKKNPKFEAPFRIATLTSKFFISFLNVQTKEK